MFTISKIFSQPGICENMNLVYVFAYSSMAIYFRVGRHNTLCKSCKSLSYQAVGNPNEQTLHCKLHMNYSLGSVKLFNFFKNPFTLYMSRLFHFRERTVIKHLFEIWPSHSAISSLVWTVQACLTNQIPIFQRVNIQIGMDRQIGMPQSICSEK